jgi:hypothetical protein
LPRTTASSHSSVLPNAKELPSVVEAAPPQRREPFPNCCGL